VFPQKTGKGERWKSAMASPTKRIERSPVFAFEAIILMITWILNWIKVNQFRKLIIQNQNAFLYHAERNIFHTDQVL